MKKRIFFIMFFVLGVVFFLAWSDQNKTNYIGGIVNSIPTVDLIIVKDSETDKQVVEFTKENDFFNDMANIYKRPYRELKQSEKKLLNKKSLYVIEYLKDNTIQYKVNIYKVEEASADVFIDKDVAVENREIDYIYSPENTNHRYVFASEKYHHVMGLNDGMKQILNEILTQQNTRVDLPFNVSRILQKVDFRYSRLAFHQLIFV